MLDTLLRSGIWMAKRPGVTFDALQVYKSMDFVKSHFLQNSYFSGWAGWKDWNSGVQKTLFLPYQGEGRLCQLHYCLPSRFWKPNGINLDSNSHLLCVCLVFGTEVQLISQYGLDDLRFQWLCRHPSNKALYPKQYWNW